MSVMKRVDNDQGCFICGEQNPFGLKTRPVIEPEARRATLELKIPEHFQGWSGIAHGGILAALLDEVSVYACMAEDTQFVTAGLAVRYLKPVPLGQPIRAVGEVVEGKKRKLTVKAELFCADVLCATAEAVVVKLKEPVSETALD